MQCPSCRTDCPDGDDYCRDCGRRLLSACPRCQADISPTDRFCGRCGYQLSASPTAITAETESGRRYATVLFCDLANYTAMTERLDPEDVKDVISRIYGVIIRVVGRYDGRIEKFIGDAAMILFGVPTVHEDDPVRALRAAFEIHRHVQDVSREFESRIGKPLSMHSGINTGLVVTGPPNPESDLFTVTGDTINVAARLEGLAGPGEILVGPETYSQARGYFEFEALAPTPIKGKVKPVRIFKALGPGLHPGKPRKTPGRRAELIGRDQQLAQMRNALARLEGGQGVIMSVCGEAGTGKSRLVEEFRASCRSKNIQWIEAHGQAYTQNNPYALIIDLLHRAFDIRESDPPDSIRMKVENGLRNLLQDGADVVPYVAGLFSLSDPSSDAPSPDIWKSRLQRAVQEILNALADQAPTVICLEDLHWADPSSLELIRTVLSDFRHAIGVVCVYRPVLSIFDGQVPFASGAFFENIDLVELTPVETLDMLKSLLKIDRMPEELRRFVEEKIGGNPFYLEEVVSSLIEAGVLVHRNGGWFLQKSIEEADIPPTIHGVISVRLDRMDKQLRRVLQEAAVIGRTFVYEILQKISGSPSQIDGFLQRLERLDLIQVRTLQPYLEYLFKHALIQEVVYSGLLKSERRRIHGRIGEIIEELFCERLSEFYESLAYHFQHSGQISKAVAYLVKAGEKSTRRYALEEAHRYFEGAYRLQRSDMRLAEDAATLIEILNHWAFVYYYRGRYRELHRLLLQHKDRAEALAAGELQAMYYAWLGCALWHRERFNQAHPYLLSALKMGEETGNRSVTGYAATWLVWICTELGRFDDALAYADQAQSIYSHGGIDPYVQVNSLAGMGYALWHRGDKKGVFAVGRKLLRIGWKHADSRSQVMGYCCIGWSRLIAGDVGGSAACFDQAVAVSADPWYSIFPRLALCYGFISEGKIREAEALIEEIIEFSRERGAEFAGTPALFFRGILLVSKGDLNKGVSLLERQVAEWKKDGSRLRYALCGCILAEVYAQIARRSFELPPAKWLKNLGALLNIGPSAFRKASICFAHYIQAAEEMGARSVIGRAYLRWAQMRQSQGHFDAAVEHYDQALNHFKACDATGYINQVQEALRTVQ